MTQIIKNRSKKKINEKTYLKIKKIIYKIYLYKKLLFDVIVRILNQRVSLVEKIKSK
jgi:hypothetical protein